MNIHTAGAIQVINGQSTSLLTGSSLKHGSYQIKIGLPVEKSVPDINREQGLNTLRLRRTDLILALRSPVRSIFIAEIFYRSRVENSAIFRLFISRVCLSEIGRTIHKPTATTTPISEAALGVSTNCAVPALTRTRAEIVEAFRAIY